MLHSPEKSQEMDLQLSELAATAPAEVPSRAVELAAGIGLGAAVIIGAAGTASAHEAPASGYTEIEANSNLTRTFRNHGLTLEQGLALPGNAAYRQKPDLVHEGDDVQVVADKVADKHVVADVHTGIIKPGQTTWEFARHADVEPENVMKAVEFDLDKIHPGDQIIFKRDDQWVMRTIVAGDTIGAIAFTEKAPASSFKMLVDFDREQVWPGDMLAVVNTEVNAAQTQQVVVEVDRGETLTEIANEHGTTVEAIVADNPRIRNPHHIEAGWDLVVDAPKPAVGPEVATVPVDEAASVPAAEAIVVAPAGVEVQKPTDPTDIEAQKVYAWYLLTERYGLSVNAAGGIMGNIGGESNFSPARVQGRPVEHISHDPRPNVGYGFAQWTTRGRQAHLEAYAAERGLPVSDPELQVDFIIKELRESFPDTLERLLQVQTVEEASDIIMTEYERPDNQSERAQNVRSDIGEAVVQQMLAAPAPAPEVPAAQLETTAAQQPAPAPQPESPTPPAAPVPQPEPASAAAEAQQILENPNIIIAASPNDRVRRSIEDVRDDGQTFTHDVNNDDRAEVPVNPQVFQVLEEIADEGNVVVTSLTTGRHSDTSEHYEGDGVDTDDLNENQLRELYERREELRIDELIYADMPEGTTTLRDGEPHRYNRDTLDAHDNHVHISVEDANE